MKHTTHTKSSMGAICAVVLVMLSGCIATYAVGRPTKAQVVDAPAGQSVLHAGLLTLKGPELGAWWALTDASGTVWRLDTTGAAQFEQLRPWQNQRIEVEGVPNGTYLSTPRLMLDKARLKPN
jgi:hypothetical protein